jgi:nucleoid-associated protein YgaU
MSLVKASLKPVTPAGAEIPFLFNPTQYTLDASNQIAEIGVPGLRAPVLQFVRGGSRTLNVDLFFDAFEDADGDVTAATDSIYGLLAPTPSTGAPPVCVFAWAARRLTCVVERVSGRFTVFRASGAPVRATLAVTLREYVDAQVVVRRGGGATGGAGGTRVVVQGDTLSAIAQSVYGDQGRWREIAVANGIANPRTLQPGTVLVIP